MWRNLFIPTKMVPFHKAIINIVCILYPCMLHIICGFNKLMPTECGIYANNHISIMVTYICYYSFSMLFFRATETNINKTKRNLFQTGSPHLKMGYSESEHGSDKKSLWIKNNNNKQNRKTTINKLEWVDPKTE